MDTDALAKVARAVSREEFVATHPSLYLVIAESADKLPIGFETAVVSFTGKPRTAAKLLDFEVLAVEKAPTNPYPDRISVGRARNCDVVMRDPSVSKLHAHFRVGADTKVELVDIDSQNGTRVNGRPLPPHQPQLMANEDMILFGSVAAKLVDAATLYDLLK